MTGRDDAIRVRRARIARYVKAAQRIGYAALLIAVIAFAVGAATDMPDWLVTLTIASLAVAIFILPVPIVLGYGIRAAERDERQSGVA